MLQDIALSRQCRLLEDKTIPHRTDSSAFLLLDLQLCSFHQHSALHSALFLQSPFRSPVLSVPSVNIPLSSPLCSFSQHSAFQPVLLRHIALIMLSLSRFPNMDILLYTKPIPLLRWPYNPKASGRPAVALCRNSRAANVCSETPQFCFTFRTSFVRIFFCQ